jgi:hypothetical protein
MHQSLLLLPELLFLARATHQREFSFCSLAYEAVYRQLPPHNCDCIRNRAKAQDVFFSPEKIALADLDLEKGWR